MNRLTGAGYALSIVSVALLAWVAWPSAGEDKAMVWVVIGGGLLSVAGMALRWTAHVLMQREIEEGD